MSSLNNSHIKINFILTNQVLTDVMNTICNNYRSHISQYTSVHCIVLSNKYHQFCTIDIFPTAFWLVSQNTNNINIVMISFSLTFQSSIVNTFLLIVIITYWYFDFQVPSTGKVGEKIKADLSFTNPLPCALTKCELTVEGPGLQDTIVTPQRYISI